MNLPYFLYILTFIGFPIIALVLAKYTDLAKYKKSILIFSILFLLHNLLFLLNYSLSGDYVDYFILSFEYLDICFLIFVFSDIPNILIKILRIIGITGICIGIIQGFIGILLFIVVSQDYEADKLYRFNFDTNTFETRRYSFGFATLDDTKYTFETYKKFNYIPIEKKVDKTVLFGLKTKLDLDDNNFDIKVIRNGTLRQIKFSSSNGECFLKTIDNN